MDTITVKYLVVPNDPDANGDTWVVFATDNEIANDNICNEVWEIANVPQKLDRIAKFVQDDGSMCEDYLVTVTNSRTVQEVKNFCNSLGFVEDQRLRNCGWG